MTIPTTTPEIVLPYWLAQLSNVDVEVRWDMELPVGPVDVEDPHKPDAWEMTVAYRAENSPDTHANGPIERLSTVLWKYLEYGGIEKIDIEISGYALLFGSIG